MKPPIDLSVETLVKLPQDRLVAIIMEQSTVLRNHAEMLELLMQQNDELKDEIHRMLHPPPTGGKPATPAPDWAKANKPVTERKPRKKRNTASFRPREKATKDVRLSCTHCPDCNRKLSGGSESSRRQVIEIPQIPVSIIDYVTIARHCGVCYKRCYPTTDFIEIAVGKSRFGVNVHALVADLRQSCRLPMRQIASLLSSLCRVRVSVGEINLMLRTVSKLGKSAYGKLRDELRGSSFAHGDETGWRENGQNGYLWSFSTPSICYFYYPKTRAGHVVTDVLGTNYTGKLVSDFYAAYNTHLGLHQRCWVHLLRAVHELKVKYPVQGVLDWAEALRDIYDRARAFTHPDSRQRAQKRVAFQAELVALAQPYQNTKLPQSTLCKRLLQFESEMFTFVEYPEVPSENNAAERTIRPRVIARKISGGTRSEAGSETMVTLSSLFATWQLRKLDCLQECRKMIATAQTLAIPAPT